MQVPRAATPYRVPRRRRTLPRPGRSLRPAAQHHPLKDPTVQCSGPNRRAPGVSSTFLRLFYATADSGEPTHRSCEQCALGHDAGTSRLGPALFTSLTHNSHGAPVGGITCGTSKTQVRGSFDSVSLLLLLLLLVSFRAWRSRNDAKNVLLVYSIFCFRTWRRRTQRNASTAKRNANSQYTLVLISFPCYFVSKHKV